MNSGGSRTLAGNSGSKPTVHITETDAEIAEEQDRDSKPISTVKSEWAEESRQLHKIQEKKREILEKDAPTLPDLLQLWRMI